MKPSTRKAHTTKNVQIAQIQKNLLDQSSVVMFLHKNLQVKHLEELRTKIAVHAGEIRVYKNTFLRRALADTKLKQFIAKIQGPIIVALTKKETPLLTKTIYQFLQKNNPSSPILASFFAGHFYENEAVIELAKLPSREELLQKLVLTLQTPLINLNALLTTRAATMKPAQT